LHQALSNLVFNALNTVSGPLPFHPFELRLPVIKAMSQGLHGALGHRVLKPVLVTFDDHQLIAFDIERLDDGREVLFLPGAPDAWSGSVVLVESERIAPLEVDLATLAKAQQRLGQGTAPCLGRSGPAWEGSVPAQVRLWRQHEFQIAVAAICRPRDGTRLMRCNDRDRHAFSLGCAAAPPEGPRDGAARGRLLALRHRRANRIEPHRRLRYLQAG
jgi:hypothetical protein